MNARSLADLARAFLSLRRRAHSRECAEERYAATDGVVWTPTVRVRGERKSGDEIKLNTPGGMRELEVLEVLTIHDLVAKEEKQ